MEKGGGSQKLKYSSKQKNKNKNVRSIPVPGPPIDKCEYYMDHEKRGKAIIFNHYQFKNFDIKERKGSEVDERRLIEEFENLGFEVEVQADKTFKGLKRRLQEVAREDHVDEDCLVVVVMSHGRHHDPDEHPNRNYSPNGFYSTSTLQAFDDLYDEEEIFKPFQGDQCPTLAGKPKIFFIQACRGPKKQGTVKINLSYEERQLEVSNQSATTKKNENTYALPTTADFLIARATFEGTKSFRDPKQGSPFIQTLCDELRDNREREKPLDLEALLTNVKRKVALTNEQMPTTYSTLLRRIYLTPKRIIQNKKLPELILPAHETRTSMESLRDRLSRQVWDGEEWVDESEYEL